MEVIFKDLTTNPILLILVKNPSPLQSRPALNELILIECLSIQMSLYGIPGFVKRGDEMSQLVVRNTK